MGNFCNAKIQKNVTKSNFHQSLMDLGATTSTEDIRKVYKFNSKILGKR